MSDVRRLALIVVMVLGVAPAARADDQGGIGEGFERLGVGLLGAVTIASSLGAVWSTALNGASIVEGERPPSDATPFVGIGFGAAALGSGAFFMFHPDWQEPTLGGIAMGIGALSIGAAIWALQYPEKGRGVAMPLVAPDGDGRAMIGLNLGPFLF